MNLIGEVKLRDALSSWLGRKTIETVPCVSFGFLSLAFFCNKKDGFCNSRTHKTAVFLKKFLQKERDAELLSSVVLVISDSQTASPALKAVIIYNNSKWNVMVRF